MKHITDIRLTREKFNILFEIYMHYIAWIPIIEEDYPDRTWATNCNSIRKSAHRILCEIDKEFDEKDTIGSNAV